jgi:hypothetical protein
MGYYVGLWLSLVIVVPAIVGAIRFANVNPIFHPFIISIWLSALNLIFGAMIVEFGYYNIVHYNIWFLLDAFVLLWLFKEWNLFESKRLYRFLLILLSIFWLSEIIFLSRLTHEYNSYFRILYSFIIILLSISTINSLLMRERKPLLKNPMFIICCTFVILNAITVLTEAFFASNLHLGDQFRINMDRIMTLTSVIGNLIYALAILWMPKRQAFILQY